MSARERRRTYWWPRTGSGRAAVLTFAALMALAQPPMVYWIANRIDPWIGGLPFLYAWLLIDYVAMIGVLLWVYHRRL